MDWAAVFKIANLLALLSWAVLIFLPRGWNIVQLLPTIAAPILFSIAYTMLVLVYMTSAEGGFDSLQNVRKLFQNDASLLAGWLHYLAFDLLIGCWIAKKADAIGVNRIIQAPILFLTFMFGPVGYFIFSAIRTIKSPQTAISGS